LTGAKMLSFQPIVWPVLETKSYCNQVTTEEHRQQFSNSLQDNEA